MSQRVSKWLIVGGMFAFLLGMVLFAASYL